MGLDMVVLKEIRIPKLSLLQDEDELFFNLHAFFVGLEKLYHHKQGRQYNCTKGFLIPELKFVQNTSADVLKQSIATLRKLVVLNQCAASKTSHKASIFTSELMTKLREQKNTVKDSLSQYIKTVEKLRKCQSSCWKSDSKVQNNWLKVYVAETLLKCRTADDLMYEYKIEALNGLKEKLVSKKVDHSRTVLKYQSKLKKEVVRRDQTIEAAEALQHDVTQAIKHKIQTGVGSYLDDDVDLDAISQCIYSVIARTYTLVTPPFDNEIARPVKQPEIQKPVYDPENVFDVFKVCNSIGQLASTEDSEPVFTSTIMSTTAGTLVQSDKKAGFFVTIHRKLSRFRNA